MKFKTVKELIEAYDEEKIEIDDNELTGYVLYNDDSNECNVYDENDNIIFTMSAVAMLKSLFEYLDVPYEDEK